MPTRMRLGVALETVMQRFLVLVLIVPFLLLLLLVRLRLNASFFGGGLAGCRSRRLADLLEKKVSE